MHTANAVSTTWMLKRHLAEVMRIEQASFEFCWEEDDFCNCLRQQHVTGRISEFQETVRGFVIYENQKTSLHILNFAVHPSFRRQSVGRQMVEMLIERIRKARRTSITLEVRESNLRAQLFFQRLGFIATKVLRGHYEDTVEDAYVMKYELSPCDR